MSGSGASNLGYGGTKPFSNVDGAYANKGNTHNPASFGSDVIPKGGAHSLYGVVNNVTAAGGSVNSLSFFKGGGRRRKLLRQKIKNITRKYKGGSRRMKQTLRKRFSKRSMARTKGRSRSFYGGAGGTSGAPTPYNDKAMAYGYALGGPMPIEDGKNIALANPPLLHRYIGGKRRRKSRRTKRRRSRSRGQRGGSYGMMSGVPKLQFGTCNGCYDFYNHYTNSCGTLPK